MPPTKSHTDSGAVTCWGSQLDGVDELPAGQFHPRLCAERRRTGACTDGLDADGKLSASDGGGADEQPVHPRHSTGHYGTGGRALFRPGPGVAGCAALFAAGSLPVREEKSCGWLLCCNTFYRGSPAYYGDEAGSSGYRDPFNRCPYPWGQEDPELLDWFRQLGALRRAFSSLLANGDYLPVLWNRDLFCFVRRQGNRTRCWSPSTGVTNRALFTASGARPGLAGGGQTTEQLAAEEGLSCCTKAENGWGGKILMSFYHRHLVQYYETDQMGLSIIQLYPLV